MALYERRSSMENLNQWRALSPTGSERRKLSFNPLGEWTPPITYDPPIPASDVSTTKRVVQVIVAVIYCLLAAGIVFGFAAIKPVLVKEGVYRDRCSKQEIDDGVWICYEQELRLNLMFTIAAVSTNVCALPLGTLLDRYGPKIASIVGTVLLFGGTLLMAFASDLESTFDAYIPGYLFLALGGPCVFIPAFQLSNTFPKHSGLILALLTGAFDTSSALFLVFRLIYQSTSGSFTIKHFFLIYLIVPVLILIAQLTIMPSQSYKSVGDLVSDANQLPTDPSTDEIHDPSEIDTLLGSKSNTDKLLTEHAQTATRSGVWGALHHLPAHRQILTPWFYLITAFTVLQMLRINYFVATVRTQYTYLLHSPARAAHVNDIFDIALPLGGVIAIPFIGTVLDHVSTPVVLALLVGMATAIGGFGLVENAEWAAWANVGLFVVYRPLYYTAVSDYAAKVFGFEAFGKVYGLVICLAGLGNFAQAGLDGATHAFFGNDPRPINAILLVVAGVVGAALVGFVTVKSWTIRREMLEREAEEAEEAEERLMPGAAVMEGEEGYGAVNER